MRNKYHTDDGAHCLLSTVSEKFLTKKSKRLQNHFFPFSRYRTTHIALSHTHHPTIDNLTYGFISRFRYLDLCSFLPKNRNYNQNRNLHLEFFYFFLYNCILRMNEIEIIRPRNQSFHILHHNVGVIAFDRFWNDERFFHNI